MEIYTSRNVKLNIYTHTDMRTCTNHSNQLIQTMLNGTHFLDITIGSDEVVPQQATSPALEHFVISMRCIFGGHCS